MKRLLLLLFAFYLHQSFAQNLPSAMHLSADGHFLATGGAPATGFYDDTIIRSVYLNFPQANYWTLLKQNYSAKIDLPATMTVDGVVYDSVGVRFKGMTSYSQAQNSDKKSFNISLDYVHPDQKIMGYKTLNLNNSFEDRSFLREVFYQHQIRQHIPSAKSNYIHLYINGADWGLYPNVQQLNGDFLEEWFLSNNGTNWRADRPSGTGGGGGGMGGGWGDGTAALNYLGPDTTEYQEYYTMKSAHKDHPWEDLVTATQVLDTVSDAHMEAVLADYYDLDRTLWHLASEIAFSDDDSYVFKGKMDYYVYWEAETGRMTPLEYDGNSAMSTNAVNWSPFYNQNKVNYPLLNRLLAVPALRQRYLAHLRTLIADELNPTLTTPLLDVYAARINALVQSDPKKLYTYAQFLSEVTVLKNFVTNRRNNLLANAEVSQLGPSINKVAYYSNGVSWQAPTAGQTATVRAEVSATGGIDHLTLYYANGLVGKFSKTTMYDDGVHDDGLANDQIFGATIPGQTAGSWVRSYVEAVAANTAKTVTFFPAGAEHNVLIYKVQSAVSGNLNVVINEIHASNQTGATDEAGENEDWIELYNKSTEAVDISGYFLSDNPANLAKWSLPAGTILPAGSYLIVWADEDSAQGPLHANFKLSAGGEQVIFLDPALALVDTVVFGQQVEDMAYARVPNGTGPFVIQAPTFNANNNSAVGTTDIATAALLSIYPNPADASVRIVLEATTPTNVAVVNTLGQTVWNATVSGTQILNTANWVSGWYLLRCGERTEKLMIRH